MKILLVEDNPDDLYFARRELVQLGHVVLGVEDGARALELYATERPDVVITDIYMPGMDGFALTRAVQERAAPHWQPVLFLSGHRDDDLQVKALQVGADGYIVKPVSGKMLDARLQVIQRLLTMQRQVEAHASKLDKYYAAEEEEKRIAQHLIRRLVNVDKLDDPAIRYWLSAAAMFSGDVIAAARTPGRVLHVLLADGTGHGLAASINVLPIIAPFYRMTEKGFGVDAIVREMNAKVRQLLPEDRFVAATLAAVDLREGYVRVWNGGNPSPFLMSARGEVEHIFALRHLPLGLLDDDEFETTSETHAIGSDAQLIVYSDGVTEAENEAGEMFGFDRLVGAVAGAGAGKRLEEAVAAVQRHMSDHAAQDDISILVVDGSHEAAIEPTLPLAHTGGGTPAGKWQFSLRLGAAEVRKLDVVPLLLGLAGQFDGARDRTGELFVILSELYNNSLDHGLLRLDSQRKLEPGGMEGFLDERQARLNTLTEGQIELGIEQFELDGNTWLRIVCRDTGPGFDHADVIQHTPAVGDLPFGRGLALVRAMSASFEFNESGNGVTAILAPPTGRGGDSPTV